MKINYYKYSFVLFGALILSFTQCSLFGKKKKAAEAKGFTPAAIDLKNSLRKISEDNSSWTRELILCNTSAVPGNNEVLGKLLKNQDDMIQALTAYYPDAGQKLMDLMHEHVNLTAALSKPGKAVKAGKGKKKRAAANPEETEKRWNENADSLADYLVQLNAQWKADQIKSILHDNLKYTKSEIEARRKRNYAEYVSAYEKEHDNALSLADTLSAGIIRNYPDKF
jgi:hypothetical protein